jgi:hypothetical protein
VKKERMNTKMKRLYIRKQKREETKEKTYNRKTERERADTGRDNRNEEQWPVICFMVWELQILSKKK